MQILTDGYDEKKKSGPDGAAFREGSRETLQQKHFIDQKDRQERQRELDAKLTLDEMIEMKTAQLKDGDLIFIYQEAANAYRLRFCGRFFALELAAKLPNNFEKPDKMKYKPFRRFDALGDFWTFFTRDRLWFIKYSPFSGAPDADRGRTSLSGYVVKATNSIRLGQKFSYEDHDHIRRWDDFFRADDLNQTEFMQVCPSCGNGVNYSASYPKYLCRKCCDNVTDKNGRKLAFYDTGFMGARCRGFYVGGDGKPAEKYESNVCFIDGVEYCAGEGKFGGVVILKKD